MKPPLHRVLCPSDLSPAGDAAVAAAFALVARGGTVRLLHVYGPAFVMSPFDATPVAILPSAPEQDATHESTVRSHLQSLVPSGDSLRDARVEIEVVRDAEPTTAIEHEAERFGADAIVLGTHGRSALGRALMGSVAADVMKRAKVPVLLVSDPRARNADKGARAAAAASPESRA